MSRTTGSKDKHGRYMTVEQLQKKLTKMAADLDKLAHQLYKSQPVRPLIDFDLIDKSVEHFKEISTMKIDL